MILNIFLTDEKNKFMKEEHTFCPSLSVAYSCKSVQISAKILCFVETSLIDLVIVVSFIEFILSISPW